MIVLYHGTTLRLEQPLACVGAGRFGLWKGLCGVGFTICYGYSLVEWRFRWRHGYFPSRMS